MPDTSAIFLPGGLGISTGPADPNRGYGPDQPGSWIYNVLDFAEEHVSRELGKGLATTSPGFQTASTQLHQSPVAMFNCPSRRAAESFLRPGDRPTTATSRSNPGWRRRRTGVAKSDYAANSGDARSFPATTSIAPTATPRSTPRWWTPTNICAYRPLDDRRQGRVCQTGVMYYRSAVRIAQIDDGTSKTYLAGEKWMPVNGYEGPSDEDGPATRPATTNRCTPATSGTTIASPGTPTAGASQEECQPAPDSPGNADRGAERRFGRRAPCHLRNGLLRRFGAQHRVRHRSHRPLAARPPLRRRSRQHRRVLRRLGATPCSARDAATERAILPRTSVHFPSIASRFFRTAVSSAASPSESPRAVRHSSLPHDPLNRSLEPPSRRPSAVPRSAAS